MTNATRFTAAVVLALLLAAPTAVPAVTLQPGDLVAVSAFTNGTNSMLIRVDPATGDREVISGCSDALCSTVIGTGPGPLSGIHFMAVGVVPPAAPASAGLSGPLAMVLLVGLLLLAFRRTQATAL